MEELSSTMDFLLEAIDELSYDCHFSKRFFYKCTKNNIVFKEGLSNLQEKSDLLLDWKQVEKQFLKDFDFLTLKILKINANNMKLN